MAKHGRIEAGILTLVAWSLAACTLIGATSLPSDPEWRGVCGLGVGHDATLHGSSSDARVTWAVDNSGAGRLDLLWPVGYTAGFSPQLQILDQEGQVVAREGDLIIGSCTNEKDGGAVWVDASQVRPPTWKSGDG